jgi:hypothetical protein
MHLPPELIEEIYPAPLASDAVAEATGGEVRS